MTDERRKLDSALKELLDDPTRRGSGGVCVMLLLSTGADANTEAELRAAGAGIRTIVGDIATAEVRAEDLERVAALDCVRYIELSSPLFSEPDSTGC